MKNRFRAGAAIIAGLCLSLGYGSPAHPQAQAPVPDSTQKGASMTSRATGPFDVKITPQEQDEASNLGRMSIDKQYHGDLEATGKGTMLTAGTAVKGSGVYVAIEKVSGSLHGRSGTFVLQHSGSMVRGTPSLTITVVPDSGTGQLVGLAGKMAVIIADGKHSYDFELTLAETP